MAKNKDINLLDLSTELGFSDQPHFQRNFKTMIGTSPLSYKNKVHSL